MILRLDMSEATPYLAIYELKGRIVVFYGEEEYQITDDVYQETLCTHLQFHLKPFGNGWTMNFKSNRKYSTKDQVILRNIINKTNEAITSKTTIDLSAEFTALETVEPLRLSGLYRDVDKYEQAIYIPIDEMRQVVRMSAPKEVIDKDKILCEWLQRKPIS